MSIDPSSRQVQNKMPQSPYGRGLKTEWSVITGAPGSGKTTLLKELRKRGYRVQADTARTILREELRRKRSRLRIRRDEASHRQRVWRTMILEAHRLPLDELVFFDYALPDNIAFAKAAGLPIDAEFWSAAQTFRYRNIFVLSPLPLLDDPIREEDSSAQQALDGLIRAIYSEMGYQIIDVPRAPLHERVNLVLKHALGAPPPSHSA